VAVLQKCACEINDPVSRKQTLFTENRVINLPNTLQKFPPIAQT